MPLARVLIVHNRHPARGGTDAAVEAEAALLRRHGHAVELILREASPDTAPGALKSVWNHGAARQVGAAMDLMRPDVVHVHELFPDLSPSIYWAAARRGVPVVQTLRDFAVVCPQAVRRREQRPCEELAGAMPGGATGCCGSANGRGGTFALALHRGAGTWQRRVAAFIVPNDFCRERLVAGGLPAPRIHVKPDSVEIPLMDETTRSGFLYAGRLTPEKGIAVLDEAARIKGLYSELRVAGQGPEAARIEQHPRLLLLGQVSPASLFEEMRRAVALVLPSLCCEAAPRVLAEAYALGLPVVASRLGALESLVHDGRTGILFAPGNAADLAAKLRWAENHPDRMAAMGQAARRVYERDMSPETDYRSLAAIYERAAAEAT